jgi:Putative regulator of cell autolysis
MIKYRIFKIAIQSLLLMVFAIFGFYLINQHHFTFSREADLTNWDFSANGNLALNGEWEFYWHKFVNYEDLKREKPDIAGYVPCSWDKYKIAGAKLPLKGFATYRLHITTALLAGSQMELYLNPLFNAYDLYINDTLIASNGKPAKDAQEEITDFQPQVIFFNIPASGFDIILHVSNMNYDTGGFTNSLILGNSNGIQNFYDIGIVCQMILLGVFLTLIFFFFSISFLHREINFIGHFILTCFGALLFYDSTGYNFIAGLLSLSFGAMIRIKYSATIWMLFFLLEFVHDLFKSDFSGIVLKVFRLLNVIAQLLIIIFNPLVFSGITNLLGINLDYLFCVIEFVFIFIIIAIGIKDGEKDGWLVLFSSEVLLLSYISKTAISRGFWILHSNGIFYLISYLFIIILVFVQTRRIKEIQEKKLKTELEFLQAQIKPHFINNALNTIISISRHDTDKARNLLADFSNYLKYSLEIRTIDYFVPLKTEIALVETYLKIEKARFENRIDIDIRLPEDMEIPIPAYILQPIVENAVVHGILKKKEGGKIEIRIQRDNGHLLFSVKDNGAGMDPQKIEIITSRESEGIGVANIAQRLKMLYGSKLLIKSEINRGTEVSWMIPIS